MGRISDPALVPIRISVPVELQTGPFTFAEANALGVTRGQLRGPSYRRLGSGLYSWIGLEDGPQLMLTAVAKRLPKGAAFSGLTAAWLHGLPVLPCDPIEVTIPKSIGNRRRANASVRRAGLASEEIVLKRAFPTTSAIRTVVDLGSRNTLTERVVSADMFLHAKLVTIAQLKGIARIRRVVEFAEPLVESPMETRLRMLLVLAGLPRPEVQGLIHDEMGHPLARPDLLYRVQRLAIEYDGENHRDRLAADNRRQNGLIGAGFRLLRFTASDVYRFPDSVVMQVRQELGR